VRRTLKASSVFVSSKPSPSFYTTHLTLYEQARTLSALRHTVQDVVAAVLGSNLDQTPNVQGTVAVFCSPYWDSTSNRPRPFPPDRFQLFIHKSYRTDWQHSCCAWAIWGLHWVHVGDWAWETLRCLASRIWFVRNVRTRHPATQRNNPVTAISRIQQFRPTTHNTAGWIM